MFENQVYYLREWAQKRWSIILISFLIILFLTLLALLQNISSQIKRSKITPSPTISETKIVNPDVISNSLISDVQKPLEFQLSGSFSLDDISVNISPQVNLIKKIDESKNMLLIYPEPSFQYDTPYNISIDYNGKRQVDTSFRTGPQPPTSTPYPTNEQKPADFDEEIMRKRYEESPDRAIEASLRLNSPVKADGFTVEFSYEKAIFIVTIVEPYSENVKKYNDWFEKMGLKDRSHFEVKNQ